MKIVVGVDLSGYWKTPVALLGALKFKEPEVLFVNAVESVLPDGSFIDFPANHPIAAIIDENEAEGLRLAQEAQATLGAGGETLVVRGEPKNELLKICDDQDADLVAVGSERKSVWGDLFFGSVAKGMLAGAKCSVLFGKSPFNSADGLTVVFATDHSEYANQAADWLIAHKPLGIQTMIVLTAASVNPLVGKQIMQHVDSLGDSILKSVLDAIRLKNEEIAAKFQAAGIPCSAEVREAHPTIAIEDAMKEHSADLLVVGAQGRGFIERLRVGSNSFEQVVNTPFNVLVVRP